MEAEKSINDGNSEKKEAKLESSDALPIRKPIIPSVLSLPIRGSDTVPQLFPAPLSPMLSTPTVRPMGAYVRPIQRRGNTYMIRDSLPSEDDPVEIDGTDRMIEDLYTETIHMSSAASKKASIFKVLYILANIVFIVGGVLVGVLTIQGYETEITKYCAAILGFSIAAIQTLMSTFSIEKRGVLLKDVSIKLRKISRQIRSLRNAEMSSKDKLRRLEEYYTEVDDFDLSIFDNSVTSASVTKATNVSQNLIKPGSDSDLSSDESDPLKGKKGINNNADSPTNIKNATDSSSVLINMQSPKHATRRIIT